jgi:hypothetical protein
MQVKVLFEEFLARNVDLELTGPARRLRSNFTNGMKVAPRTSGRAVSGDEVAIAIDENPHRARADPLPRAARPPRPLPRGRPRNPTSVT